MTKSLLFASVIILFTHSLAAQKVGHRAQWLFDLGELLSYHVAIDYLRDEKCRNHSSNSSSYGGIQAITLMRDRFPTQLGKFNFMKIAKFHFGVPKVLAAYKFVQEIIDKSMKESLDHGKALNTICANLIETYKSWPMI